MKIEPYIEEEPIHDVIYRFVNFYLTLVVDLGRL